MAASSASGLVRLAIAVAEPTISCAAAAIPGLRSLITRVSRVGLITDTSAPPHGTDTSTGAFNPSKLCRASTAAMRDHPDGTLARRLTDLRPLRTFALATATLAGE